MPEKTDRTAVLYVRSVAPCGVDDVQRRTIDRLERLAADGVLESVEYEVWGDGVPADDSGTVIKGVYDEFVEWADDQGYTLAPAFRDRETGTMVSDECRTVISFPLLCLGVYEENELEAVFPCSDDERTYTIEDGLVGLEHRTVSESTSVESDDQPVPQSGALNDD